MYFLMVKKIYVSFTTWLNEGGQYPFLSQLALGTL